MALVLDVCALPFDQVVGAYTIDGVPEKMPPRALFLGPAAAASFVADVDVIAVSDIFRSPESSLEAVRSGRGALPPGFSAHNFAEAIDLRIGETQQRLKKKLGAKRVTKADLDAWMESKGFYCHRTDHKTGKDERHKSDESWHFNYLGVGVKVDPKRFRSTSGFIESRIYRMHSKAWLEMDAREAQRLLAAAKLYGGEIDGKIGPISRQAIRAFQRTWGYADTGQLDEKTRRVLAVVTLEKNVVALPAPALAAA